MSVAVPAVIAPARSCEQALDLIREHRGPILVDFDETLYLRNSTEDFLDSATPGLAALLLLRALDLLRPWRLTGGASTRDVWRVRVVSTLLPWTWWRWRRAAANRARDYLNAPLARALTESNSEQWIVSSGFAPIIAPVAAAMGYPGRRIVAARLDRLDDRRQGKLLMARAALGEPLIQQSLVVTDSEDDRPLLEQCALPLLVRWPEAFYEQALSRVYLPGLYLSRIKRPGERYIWTGIVQEDFALWVIASIGLSTSPLRHLLGLGLLLVSFWAIYERGYVDNDRIASTLEAEPKLSDKYRQVRVATPMLEPWLWALASGAAALLTLRAPQQPSADDALRWLAVLAATAFGFWAYNRFDKRTRIWLFTGLQAARSTAFATLVPIPLAGSLAIGAHVVVRWLPYYFYRVDGRGWPEGPFFLSRLSFYTLFWIVLAITQGLNGLWNWTALALLAWNVYRARKELHAALIEIEWLPSKRKRDRS